jgi:4-azaleucine resistance transporter AzlC
LVTHSDKLADMAPTPDDPSPGPRDHSVRRVLELSAPIGLAFIPLGMALGLLVVHAGLAWWWAPVFAAVIYAGSLEFLMVGLAASAAPVASVALTTFIVNSRHVFYALSFPLDRVKGVWGKLYSTYTLSDEAYAVGVSPEARTWTTRPILIMQLSFQLLWVTGASLGGLVGAALPIERLKGLDFALTALFIVLAIDAYRQRPDRVTLVAAAMCAVAAWLLVPGQLLVCAFAAFTGVLLARLVLENRRAGA